MLATPVEVFVHICRSQRGRLRIEAALQQEDRGVGDREGVIGRAVPGVARPDVEQRAARRSDAQAERRLRIGLLELFERRPRLGPLLGELDVPKQHGAIECLGVVGLPIDEQADQALEIGLIALAAAQRAAEQRWCEATKGGVCEECACAVAQRGLIDRITSAISDRGDRIKRGLDRIVSERLATALVFGTQREKLPTDGVVLGVVDPVIYVDRYRVEDHSVGQIGVVLEEAVPEGRPVGSAIDKGLLIAGREPHPLGEVVGGLRAREGRESVSPLGLDCRKTGRPLRGAHVDALLRRRGLLVRAGQSRRTPDAAVLEEVDVRIR